ncbi:MAG TPA: ATP-binding protein [Pyrinomonadaceae bacterium]|nr:ATP-binding protein [Pyrinomonadaceae bacterium]
MTYERRLLLLSAAAGLPGTLVALLLLWTGDHTPALRWTTTTLLAVAWAVASAALRRHVKHPLQTLSNLLAALREGDYSVRALDATPEDALGEVFAEVNALGDILRQQRLGAVEASALLRKVIEEIDVAVFAFDPDARLRLVNPAGERLLQRSAETLLGRRASELGLGDFLDAQQRPRASAVQRVFPGGAGHWGVRRSTFHEGGLRHQLLVLADLSRTLREEELKAWQRLVRVLGHELNNSLAPIKSIAGSLARLAARDEPPADWREDMERGLSVIASRADALGRFTTSYARLAQLPPPRLAPVNVAELVADVVKLETRLAAAVEPGPALTVRADRDQLEQLLINLLRNAVEASLETGGGVRVGWGVNHPQLELWVRDEGPGLANTSNLFVPFFTTKPGGNGVGLVLSRQIAEAHGGTLTLRNAASGRGCEARLRLPL